VRECVPDLISPVRIYFNKGRGRYPDRLLVLHLPKEIAAGLQVTISRWKYYDEDLTWSARSWCFPDDDKMAMQVFLRLHSQMVLCPDCEIKNEVSLILPRPPECAGCNKTLPFQRPSDKDALRHFKVATM